MLKKNKRTLILTSIIILFPALAGILLWNKLPDPMATHFGMDNVADGFSSKPFAVIGIPLLLLGIQFFCAIVTAKDPRQQNISNKMFTLVLWIIPCVSIFVAVISYPYNLGITVDIGFLASLFVGLLFIIIGNYMPKTRQNYTIGIKLPWTLANEENWNKTHHLAGVIWIIAGLVIMLSIFVGTVNNIGLILGVTLVAVLIPSIYSFALHVNRGL